MKSTNRILLMTDQNEGNYHHQFLFRCTCKRWSVVTDIADTEDKLKEEVYSWRFINVSKKLYSRLFRLAKRTTTEKIWNSLLCKALTDSTDVENISTQVHELACTHGSLSMRDRWTGRRLPAALGSRQRSRPDEGLCYPLVYYGMILSRHMKWKIYKRDTKVLSRASYEFGFRHYENRGAKPRLCMMDIKMELVKSNSLQRVSRTK